MRKDPIDHCVVALTVTVLIVLPLHLPANLSRGSSVDCLVEVICKGTHLTSIKASALLILHNFIWAGELYQNSPAVQLSQVPCELPQMIKWEQRQGARGEWLKTHRHAVFSWLKCSLKRFHCACWQLCQNHEGIKVVEAWDLKWHISYDILCKATRPSDRWKLSGSWITMAFFSCGLCWREWGGGAELNTDAGLRSFTRSSVLMKAWHQKM